MVYSKQHNIVLLTLYYTSGVFLIVKDNT